MMRSNQTALLTVEEFVKIPDPPGGHYELHHGELALVPPPIFKHALAQKQLVRVLERICKVWFVDKEFAFRPLPEYEVWIADVAMVSEQRAHTIPMNGWLSGSPELVAEVLSTSNAVQEMKDREQTCFRGGCREFWVLDSNLRSIRVSTPDGQARMYNVGDEISLDRFSPGKLPVGDVFPEGISNE